MWEKCEKYLYLFCNILSEGVAPVMYWGSSGREGHFQKDDLVEILTYQALRRLVHTTFYIRRTPGAQGGGGEMYHLKDMITSLHKRGDFKKEEDKIAFMFK